MCFLFNNTLWLSEWHLSYSGVRLRFIFLFDFFSFFFSTVVIGVSTGIYFFGSYYIDVDYKQKGFSLILFLFIFSMLFLIFGGNLFTLVLGWDGLGLTSYILVVYYIRFSRANGGILTFLTNRLGDIFFLFSFCCLYYFYTFNPIQIKQVSVFFCFFIILTAFTKRAQIPFSSWLPAAIAAPTPVSSLVHSSTLVTAGVYLLFRFHIVIFFFSSFIMVVSLLTMFIAGLSALFEWDLKKIIAFSTLSQIGFILFSLRQGFLFFCFFHLLCHALFKASLFILSGVIIHNMDSFQDFRSCFNFRQLSSIRAGVLICVLCLCGFPFVSGFFSKDFILDSSNINILFYIFFILSIMLTISYSIRFAYYSIKNILTKHLGLVYLYFSVFYLILSIWFIIMVAIFIGAYWVDWVVYFRVFFRFFSTSWKIFYCLALVILFVLLFMLVVSFLNVFEYRYFLKKIFFLALLFSSFRFSQMMKINNKQILIVSQGWYEAIGAQGLSKLFYQGSLIFLFSEGFLFLSTLFILIFFLYIV